MHMVCIIVLYWQGLSFALASANPAVLLMGRILQRQRIDEEARAETATR